MIALPGRRQSLLSLARGGTDRYVPWMIAPMAYLATLVLALVLALSGLVGTLTAQLPATADPGQRAARVEAALGVIRAAPGVRQAAALDAAKNARMLGSWLGEEVLQSDLPLPVLIDIRLEPEAGVDLAALRGRLAAAVPGATVDDHASWLTELRALSGAVQGAALVIVALIALAAVITVVFVIRAQLSIHHPVILLLHQLGATDAYVAREFERHALVFGAVGGTIGLVLALATVLGIAAVTGGRRRRCCRG